jgi:16S rRNA (guanine527-N7)-methyltransferase
MNLQNILALEKLYQEYSLSSEQCHQFDLYVQLIENWNKRTNLVSNRDISKIVTKHIYQSLSFCAIDVFPKTGILIDIGSGAGFPGIPIKIFRPMFQVYLIDSKRMRYLFLSEVIDMLQLKNTIALCDRIETIAKNTIIRADIIVARSVAKLKILWEWSLPFLLPQGILVVQKGGDFQEELEVLQSGWDASIRLINIQGNKFIVIEKI